MVATSLSTGFWASGLRVELVDRDESLLVLGVDVRDHLDVRLEPEPRSFAFRSPSTW